MQYNEVSERQAVRPIPYGPGATIPGEIATRLLRYIAWVALIGGLFVGLVVLFRIPITEVGDVLVGYRVGYNSDELWPALLWIGGGALACVVLLVITSIAENLIALRRGLKV